MSADLLWNIALVIVFVLVGGVFAATEMALVTLRESQINAIAARGKRGQKVAGLARNPNTFLSAVQIGVTVAGFASAAYGATSIAPSVAPLFEGWGWDPALSLTVATVLLTLVIAYLSLVLGELVPKRLAIQRNASFAYGVAPILDGFAKVMRPVIWLLSVSTNALVRLLGGDPHKTGEELTDEEVRDIVASHEGLPDDERRILDDVLSLRGRQLSEVMRPRPEVTALDDTFTVREALSQVHDQPFSRYPVADKSIDDIVGFIHVRDLFEAAGDPDAPLRSIVRPISYFPSTAGVLPTLTRMRADGQHIAVVVDEYGGTDGIVTLEDLVEEVVGEIFDEYDPATLPASDKTLLDGRLNLAEFEEQTGVDLPRGSSDTIAGFVTERLGRLAVVGDVIEVPGATIQVTAMDRRRIAEVRVTPREDEPLEA
ncbi:hemolysin family protein [Microbacterium sp. EYE_5]|uniref:hemolysin family protein n=1 Tax=unclassified Microbacterium TaxID=2609290 RepID=UPI002005DC25|nr:MULTISPECIES: hemolysin family protein [unclassified Microbacterium]MCK6081810.1 hemolysin family protein [Microbacterium sp. EYE_382]MCK6087080.1 hemolysin family protein [Microbacterium sp. EYE_384]MCK6124942.1 hemolysin family protein [Microbacterium sp. EYE_80]MCK6127843.1 hemolysin family protein [Microbacterium sp. EYE_79]MCK6142764.1 hemolysin family protein [Microbacterium sp. EYE_39]